jgi:predicted ribosomally synthesized peptide with nif11-like leader
VALRWSRYIQWGYTDSAFEPQLEAFLAEVKNESALQTELLLAKTCKDVANIANSYGYEISGSVILRYQAIQILKLSDEKAENVASGVN